MKTDTAVKPQHTPTPWKLNNNGRIVNENGGGIWLESSENAFFIVNAVNSHERMLSLLRRLDEFFTNGTSVSPFMQMCNLADDNYTFGLAVREAIAQAEGK